MPVEQQQPQRILVIDDDPMALRFICDCLDAYELDVVPDGLSADRKLQESTYRVVVSDVKLPGIDGLGLLSRHGGDPSATRFLMLSGQSTIQDAVAAMKLGAYDFLTKPFRREDLQGRVESAFGYVRRRGGVGGTVLIGESPPFRDVVAQLDLVTPVPTTVLLTGETGTGKEVAARYLHERSPRATAPFVSLHCGAVPDNLLEDELFGHVKGAFTGAVASRPGCFEMADGGTLFLDEIGTMTLSLQSKLLRVLQEPVIRRIGDAKDRRVDVRLIAATNADLEEMVGKGEFRADLYYRLSVFPVRLPRLGERGDDVLLLARHFGETIGEKLGFGRKVLSPKAEEWLLRRAWPGNVRQLENTIERAVIVSRGRERIDAEDLCLDSESPALDGVHSEVRFPDTESSFEDMVGEFERRLILRGLEITGGNKKQAAELLGLKRTTLIEKLKRLEGAKRAS